MYQYNHDVYRIIRMYGITLLVHLRLHVLELEKEHSISTVYIYRIMFGEVTIHTDNI